MILDPRFLDSSVYLTDLALCQARLQLDARWPWIVLIPNRPDLVEIEDLSKADSLLLTNEIVLAGHAVRALARAFTRPVEKLNVGQLGNIVSQLHIHVVGRRSDDPAWPGPVWGYGSPLALTPQAISLAIETARRVLVDPDASAN